jgi:hypothetical protein
MATGATFSPPPSDQAVSSTYEHGQARKGCVPLASVRECPLTTTRQINLAIKNDYGKSTD